MIYPKDVRSVAFYVSVGTILCGKDTLTASLGNVAFLLDPLDDVLATPVGELNKKLSAVVLFAILLVDLGHFLKLDSQPGLLLEQFGDLLDIESAQFLLFVDQGLTQLLL